MNTLRLLIHDLREEMRVVGPDAPVRLDVSGQKASISKFEISVGALVICGERGGKTVSELEDELKAAELECSEAEDGIKGIREEIRRAIHLMECGEHSQAKDVLEDIS